MTQIDFAALHAAEQETVAGPATTKRAYTTSFLTRRFTLFALDPVVLYLQGPQPISLDSEEAAIASALKVAACQGKGRNQAQHSDIIKTVAGPARSFLFQDKQAHKAFLLDCLARGIPVPPAATSKEAILSTIEDYLLARDTFLAKEGLANAEEWLARKAAKSKPISLSAADIADALDAL